MDDPHSEHWTLLAKAAEAAAPICTPELAAKLCEALDRLSAAIMRDDPIDMVLFCPNCYTQHIDKPEGQFYPGMTAEESVLQNRDYNLWDNPPHRSHLCHECGHIWRPADVSTNGVAAIKTQGKKDSPIPAFYSQDKK